MFRSTSQIDDDGEDEQANDGDEFNAGEAELSFTIDGDSEDVEGDDDADDEGYPGGDINAFGALPILDYHGCSGDLGAYGDGSLIPALWEDLLVSLTLIAEVGCGRRSWI